MIGYASLAVIVVMAWWQPTMRGSVRLPPGPQVTRTVHDAALFSRDGNLVEGVMVLRGWWRGATPSMSADIRWNGIEPLAGGMIIMEQWPHYQLCRALEERPGERLRCLIVHQLPGTSDSLVVAGLDGRDVYTRARSGLAEHGDTDELGSVTVYFEMRAD